MAKFFEKRDTILLGKRMRGWCLLWLIGAVFLAPFNGALNEEQDLAINGREYQLFFTVTFGRVTLVCPTSNVPKEKGADEESNYLHEERSFFFVTTRRGSSDEEEMYQRLCVNSEGEFDLSVIPMREMCLCGLLRDAEPAETKVTSVKKGRHACIDGYVRVNSIINHPCSNVDLLSFVSLFELNSAEGWTGRLDKANDIWGWTASNGQEIAIIGLVSGTAFVDVTDPVNPIYRGKLPTHTGNAVQRDMKTYLNHAFIVSESKRHGMQVFDLTQLVGLDASESGRMFSETAHYGGFGNAHNLFINEETGFAYVVGSQECNEGLYIIDLSTPTNPTFAGCFGDDGYTHDVQCVLYNGTDTRYHMREICFACNEDTVTIIDVTDKNSPVQLSRTGYPDSVYTHQGWLTKDHNFFIFGDEFDESISQGTKTLVLDVADLVNPRMAGFHESHLPATDHNQYVIENLVFQANYKAGLRILQIDNAANAEFTEVAYFDTYPRNDRVGTDGAWSVYPYFASRTLVVSDQQRGLFVLKQTPSPPDVCMDESNECSSILGFSRIKMHKTFLGNEGYCVTNCMFGAMIDRAKRRGWRCGPCR